MERTISCSDGIIIHCELPDGSIAAFPSWMMDVQVCSQLTEGPPQLSLEGLVALRNFLNDKLSESRTSQPNFSKQGG